MTELFKRLAIWLFFYGKEYFDNPIGYPHSENFEWQAELKTRQLYRSWERIKIFPSLKALRWFWVLLAGFGSICLICWLLTGEPFAFNEARKALFSKPSSDSAHSEMPFPNASAWTLIAAFASAPIAFVIWWFRDTNTLWQIENQRKDTNLKDFQKLSEWASGLHLIESQVTQVQEESAGREGRSEKKITSTQSSHPSTSTHVTALQPPSRAEGAASLQIAAVYQLQAFLRGDYGEHFKRPAFALLKTVWLSLVQPHVSAWNKEFTLILEKREIFNEAGKPYRVWKANLQNLLRSPLAVAINNSLTSNHGLALQHHANDLPNTVFAGMKAHQLELDGMNLRGIQWQCADLREAQLQGAHLQQAKLQDADLMMARLQGANLYNAQLQGADLFMAQLQGANLALAKLQGADLFMAQLQGANLFMAHLQGVNLSKADLTKTQFTKKQLAYLELSEEQLASIIVVDDDAE